VLGTQPRDPHVVKAMSADEVVREYADFVAAVAHRVIHELALPDVFDDLQAWGFEGLLDAHKRFDPDLGYRFSTYAYYRIRGAMIDGTRRSASIIHTPRSVRAAAGLNELACEIADTEANDVAPTTLADATSRLANYVDAAVTVVMLSDLGPDEQDRAVEPTQHKAVETNQLQKALRNALKELPDDERALIVGHYLEGDTLTEVAKRMGKTQSWASRRPLNALRKLRRHFEFEEE
jgi:RNA polymerase sigma factor for flagellar operon FliA